jgi:hypothetical protein
MEDTNVCFQKPEEVAEVVSLRMPHPEIFMAIARFH